MVGAEIDTQQTREDYDEQPLTTQLKLYSAKIRMAPLRPTETLLLNFSRSGHLVRLRALLCRRSLDTHRNQKR
jgi:hypothetical protein